MFLNLVAQILHCRVQLRIAPAEGSVRKVVNLDVRVYPVAFDQPLSFGTIDAVLGRGGDSIVR